MSLGIWPFCRTHGGTLYITIFINIDFQSIKYQLLHLIFITLVPPIKRTIFIQHTLLKLSFYTHTIFLSSTFHV